MSSPKIGIVCSGGGMTSAYSCGALEAIYYHYGFKYPEVMVGASGSAGSCSYFAAGQIHVGREIWCDHLTNHKFISYKHWPVMNIDYVVNTIFRKKVPLNIGKVRTSPIQLYIPVTNAKTGLTSYFSNKDKVDLFNVLQAAKTVPIVAGKAVCINDDCRYEYADGDIAQQLNRHTSLARHYGCDQVVVIDNESDYGFGMKVALNIFSLFTTDALKRAVLRGKSDKHNLLQNNEHTTVLRPSRPLQMRGLTDQREKVERAYDMGYHDAVNNYRLQKLFAA